ncbi:MAG TPA: GNAT family N-acetyltransferase [Blastocatellia bacterium]|jgi:GNAT superfamily N-acetyltransferase|nr:GNAT family N-acetyltransferase [Blastocatellia bacterium]
MEIAPLSIELLRGEHQRESFDCGEESLNRYLRQYASQHQKKNIGRVYVATERGQRNVVGYFTLANGAVAFQSVPRAKGLPREYPIPVVLLARLAVDLSMRGRGLGGVLLFDALKRASEASHVSAAYAVIVDALGEPAKEFYQHYRFQESLDDPLRLFLPMHDIRALLAGL